EAILFTTAEPLAIESIQKIMKIRKDAIEKLLHRLEDKYSSPESGIMISNVGGYKLVVKDEFTESVSNLTPHSDLSRGLLRVLSIIAYHEPISQSDIVKVIGNRTYDYIKDLESRNLIKTEKKSRTKVIVTTPLFEQYFGAKKHEIKKEFEESVEDNKPGDNAPGE
ncbi:MAG: SMC-Scp complex subunit ScpB, partial [Candidatus Aenigmarchaeota archaeon]|nr:SMC-Scp complex subunit ScpB [Candidatus Aenigmarchaeota archaeon]